MLSRAPQRLDGWLGRCVRPHAALLAALIACSSGSARPAADGGARPAAGGDANLATDADAGGRGLHDSGVLVLRDAGVGDSGSGAAPGDAGAAIPAPCPASAQGDVALGHDVFKPNTGKKEITSLTYTNVGASGQYAEVVSGWSKATGCVSDSDGTLCKTQYRQPKQVSGALAPFNEEMTLVFAGPIELYEIAVYHPTPSAWSRDAFWDRCRTDGLVFGGNKAWYECNGFVESCVSADGKAESNAPVQFSGSIAAGTEVHVMSSALCSDPGDACGWTSGLALRGFKGDAAGSKLFAVKLRMPLGDKTPAYWILPSQVIRSSQYGCNCRGQGSDPTYKGGCGELDVAEILGGVTSSLEATSTLYSFQDITGGGSVAFDRPVQEAAVFLVIFDAAGRQIALRRLAANAFDFAASQPTPRVAAWLADQGTQRALSP